MVLTTIGYEGLSIDDFLKILRENFITTIVDVRELPLSHKTGFSKSALTVHASLHEISYIHARALGCPREIRHDYRADNDWDRFSERYLDYLETQISEIEILSELVQNEKCCLLCYEADPLHCHRSYVAEAVSDLTGDKLNVIHLGATS